MRPALRLALKVLTGCLVLIVSGLVLHKACGPRRTIDSNNQAIVARAQDGGSNANEAASVRVPVDTAVSSANSARTTQSGESIGLAASSTTAKQTASPQIRIEPAERFAIAKNQTRPQSRVETAANSANSGRAIADQTRMPQELAMRRTEILKKKVEPDNRFGWLSPIGPKAVVERDLFSFELNTGVIIDKKEKTEKTNDVIVGFFKAGNNALMAKNYDEAIMRYDEGLAFDAEQPALLTNKALALRARGLDRYNMAIKSKVRTTMSAGLNAAKTDFRAAVGVVGQAYALIKSEPAATDPAWKVRYNSNKIMTLGIRAESMRLFVAKVDESQVDAGQAAFEEYIAAETDPARKWRAERDLARMLFSARAFERAQVEYEKLLAQDPGDLDALAKMGLSLFNIAAKMDAAGTKDEAKVKYQQAADYLQQFLGESPYRAPFTTNLRAKAITVLAQLKNEQNIKPRIIFSRRR